MSEVPVSETKKPQTQTAYLDVTQIPEISVSKVEGYALSASAGYSLLAIVQIMLGLFYCNVYGETLETPFMNSFLYIGQVCLTIITVLEYKRGSTLNVFVFGLFAGLFYLIGTMGVRESTNTGAVNDNEKPFFNQMATIYILYMIFSIIMTIGALRSSFVLVAAFGLNIFAFVLLASSYWKFQFLQRIDKSGGSFLIMAGIVFFYYGGALMVNLGLGQLMMPLLSPNEQFGQEFK